MLLLHVPRLVTRCGSQVSCEYVYKRSYAPAGAADITLSQQNAVLYTYGVLLNAAAFAISNMVRGCRVLCLSLPCADQSPGFVCVRACGCACVRARARALYYAVL